MRFQRTILSLLTYLVMASAAGTCSLQAVDDAGYWTAVLAQGDLHAFDSQSDRLKWWFDGHLRLLEDTDGFNQSIIRPGVGWTLNPNHSIWAGYAWIRTEPLSRNGFDENCIWQQWIWSKSAGDLKFQTRSRFEQRLIETGDDLGLRWRQFVRVTHSLPSRPKLTLVGWDELFYHLNDTDWGAQAGFNQNRAFVGIGFKPKPNHRWRVEVGYLNQVIEVANASDRNNHIVSVNFFRSP